MTTASILSNDTRLFLSLDALDRGEVDFLLPGKIRCEECKGDLAHGYIVVEEMEDRGEIECHYCQSRYPVIRR